MAEENEEELLGSDYVTAINDLAQQTTQIGGGFYQLSNDSDYEDRYPNAINDFLGTEGVKKIADDAGVTTDSLAFPFQIPDGTINDINDILKSADPLSLSDAEIVSLRNTVDAIIQSINIPTADALTQWTVDYSQFVSAAIEENVSFPTNFREIPLVSTDISLDSFLGRTGIRKLVAIRINNLVYPFITERYKIPSPLQGELIGVTASAGDTTIYFSDIIKEAGVDEIEAGSMLLITDEKKNIRELKQQKIDIEYYDEGTMTVRLKTPLLFDLDDSFMLNVYQYTKDQVLSPKDFIKIPQ